MGILQERVIDGECGFLFVSLSTLECNQKGAADSGGRLVGLVDELRQRYRLVCEIRRKTISTLKELHQTGS